MNIVKKLASIACALIVLTLVTSYGQDQESSSVPSYVDPTFFQGSTSELELDMKNGKIVSIFQANQDVPLVSLSEGYFIEEIIVDDDGDCMLLMVHCSNVYWPYAYSLLIKKISVAGESHWKTIKTVLRASEVLSEERSWVEDLVFLSADENMAILRVARARVPEGEEPEYIKYSAEIWQIDPAKHLRTVKNLKFY